MAIKDQKIYTSDYSGKDVAGLPDSVVGQADWLKGRFDALTKELVVPRFNAVIDELSGEEGGDSIGIGWRHGTLGKAVVSQDVRELRVDGGNRLEMAVDEDYWITPPVGHTLVDAHGQQRRETPRLQFLNADVSVVGDTTVVRPLSEGDGLPGRDGLSAYDEALLGGYHGTQEEFDALLAGLDETSAGAAGAVSPSYLRNADFTRPFNTEGQQTYTGTCQRTIDHWKMSSNGFSPTLELKAEGLLFTCRSFEDRFCQELKGLSHLSGKTLTLSVFGLPQSLETGFNATIQLRYPDGSTMTRSSGLVGVGAGENGALATASCLMPGNVTDEVTVSVSVWCSNEGDAVLLKWAKLEVGAQGTRPVPREPVLESLINGPDVGFKAGTLTGTAVDLGEVRFVDCGFTPSAVLMVVGGLDWYKSNDIPYFRASSYIGLATRETPYASSELQNAIEIVEGGFEMTLSTWSEFNREGYTTNYIAFR